jgi:glucose-6-phosphate 1-dehydrogenase
LLAKAGLVPRDVQEPWSRLVLEKPFGKDLASAQDLDRDLHNFLSEDQIYRIDHYLGKDTVQNLLSFRFGNAIFEPLFNRGYIDQVQLTVAETVGMEGRRGAYYDHAGAIRDVLQNHLLQLLALVTMEPPARITAKEMRDEKVKVLHSLVPLHDADINRWVIRGQYGAGQVGGKPVRAYRDEEAVAKNSTTDTYVAMRLRIENWRWAGVPFLLRTGKRLPKRVTEVAVHFKSPPSQLFAGVEGDGRVCEQARRLANVLVFRIQPDEGISLSFAAKRPGMQLDLNPVLMNFRYGEAFDGCLPDAYERLLLDALRGDATLFMRSDEVETAWEFVTPILEAWKREPAPNLPNYAAGTWGPKEADRLTEGCQYGWRQP